MLEIIWKMVHQDRNGILSMVDEKEKLVIFKCGSPWGIGVYACEYDPSGSSYGYPPTDSNPHDFFPDPESCRPEEITAWEKAKVEWNEQEKSK